jgi:hypothetical protein
MMNKAAAAEKEASEANVYLWERAGRRKGRRGGGGGRT